MHDSQRLLIHLAGLYVSMYDSCPSLVKTATRNEHHRKMNPLPYWLHLCTLNRNEANCVELTKYAPSSNHHLTHTHFLHYMHWYQASLLGQCQRVNPLSRTSTPSLLHSESWRSTKISCRITAAGNGSIECYIFCKTHESDKQKRRTKESRSLRLTAHEYMASRNSILISNIFWLIALWHVFSESCSK